MSALILWAAFLAIAAGLVLMIWRWPAAGHPSAADRLHAKAMKARPFMRRDPDMIVEDFPLPGKVGQRGDVGLWIHEGQLCWNAIDPEGVDR